MRIAIAGSTGTVGRCVVEQARAHGHEVVGLSRAEGVDLLGGDGLAAALDGADAVIDVANVNALSAKAATAFFGATTRSLLDAGRAAGVRHHVALSIVGVDRVPSGYYAGKLLQEELVAAADVPGSILRATQFHEFAGQVMARQKGPVVLVPTMRSATVSTREVAERLVTLAAGQAVGRAVDLRGPEVHRMPDLARRLLRAEGRRRLVVPLRLPGAAGSAMAGDGLLPTGPSDVATVTFDEWLATR